MVFFMFSTVYLNDGIEKSLKSNTRDVLNASIIAILFFSVLFLSYAYTAFARSRKREFGLYMLLGMNSGAIRRLLLMENTIIAFASLLAGLITGSVLARLFFMTVVNLLKLGDIRYQFNILTYGTTVGVFLAEFLIILLLSDIIAGRAEIIDTFKSGRTAEKDWLRHPLFGVAGLCILTYSLLLKYLYTVGLVEVREMSSVFVVLCFTGLYLIVSQFGNVLEALVKKSKAMYYRNLPGISGVKHKIFRIKTVLFLIAMFSAITVYFIGTALSTLIQADETAESEQPFHLAFVEKGSAGGIPDKELEQILNSGDMKPAEQKNIEFLETEMASGLDYKFKIAALCEKSFNILYDRRLKIEEGRYIMVCPPEMSMSEGSHLDFEECILSAGSQTFHLKLDNRITERDLNKVKYLSEILLVISNSDYERMKTASDPSRIGRLHLINYEDWHRTSEISAELETRLKQADGSSMRDMYEYGHFPVLGSRVATYRQIRSEGSLMLFLTLFLGALFFVASASIIYFKLFSEIDEEREKYRKYFLIGILEKEYGKYVTGELLVLFFLPLVIGAAIALAYGCIDLKFSPFRFESMAYLALVTLAYLAFQAVFYLAAKQKYINDVIGV